MSLELGKKDCFWDISIEIFELENILNCRRCRLFCNYAENWQNEEIKSTVKKNNVKNFLYFYEIDEFCMTIERDYKYLKLMF